MITGFIDTDRYTQVSRSPLIKTSLLGVYVPFDQIKTDLKPSLSKIKEPQNIPKGFSEKQLKRAASKADKAYTCLRAIWGKQQHNYNKSLGRKITLYVKRKFYIFHM